MSDITDRQPSRAAYSTETDPATRPKASFTTAKIWVNAFIPRDIPGQTFPSPLSDGNTMIRPACIPPLGSNLHFCYLTDQRGFSSFINATSRLHSEITVNVETAQVVQQIHHTDPTVETICETGVLTCSRSADTSRMNFPLVIGDPGGVIRIDIDAAARNECAWLTHIFGDIKIAGSFVIDTSLRQVSFTGSVSVFPAFEAYATADDGAGVPVFLIEPAASGTPCDLPLMIMRQMGGQAII